MNFLVESKAKHQLMIQFDFNHTFIDFILFIQIYRMWTDYQNIFRMNYTTGKKPEEVIIKYKFTD